MPTISVASSLGWSHYTLYEALPRITQRGFKKVEIASFATYCFHFNNNSPRPAELKYMLADLGLEPVCLNYYTRFYDASLEENIDKFVDDWQKKILDIEQIGIGMMTMAFGARNNQPDQKTQLTNAVKAYNRVGTFAKKHGVRMLLEIPHLYGLMPRPEQVYWVFDRLESDNVGALIDSSHWGIIQYDLEELISNLGDRLWHIHLRDSQGPDTADMKQNLELTPGQGSVDFQRFAKALDDSGYTGDIGLDFEYRDIPLDQIEHEFDQGLAYLAQSGWQLAPGIKCA